MYMTECSDQSKACTKCEEVKSLTEFPKSSRYKSGYNAQCKCCLNSTAKAWRDSNSETFKETRKKNYWKNVDKMREEKRRYVERSKPLKIAYDVEYRKRNKEHIKQLKKNWQLKMKNDPIFKIKVNLRRRVHHALMGRNKSDNTFNLIGCSPEEFKSHIESLWLEGMSWDNYGTSGWHIDHIKECHTFDLSDPEQQRECFHYSNQRPLWAKDNLSRPKKLHKNNTHKIHQSHQEESQ